MKILSERLKKLRKNKNVSQNKVANFLGLTQGAYGMYERNERTPEVKTLKKIAEYFNVSIDYLVGISDEKYSSEKIKSKLINTDINLDFLLEINESNEIKEILNLLINLDKEKTIKIKKIIKLALDLN